LVISSAANADASATIPTPENAKRSAPTSVDGVGGVATDVAGTSVSTVVAGVESGGGALDGASSVVAGAAVVGGGAVVVAGSTITVLVGAVGAVVVVWEAVALRDEDGR
jgi:hypothetical protein